MSDTRADINFLAVDICLVVDAIACGDERLSGTTWRKLDAITTNARRIAALASPPPAEAAVQSPPVSPEDPQ